MKRHKPTLVAAGVVFLAAGLSTATAAIVQTAHKFDGACGEMPAIAAFMQSAGLINRGVCKLVKRGVCSETECLVSAGPKRGYCKLFINSRGNESCACVPRRTSH